MECDIAIEPKARKERNREDNAECSDMWRHYHKAEVDETFADDVVIDDVVPYCVEQSGCCTTRQITKNLLRNKSPQRFNVE